MCPGPGSSVHCMQLKSKRNCQPVSAERPGSEQGGVHNFSQTQSRQEPCESE